MRESWPHAPPHYFTPRGIYMITAATLHRKPVFDSDAKLDLFGLFIQDRPDQSTRRFLSGPVAKRRGTAKAMRRRIALPKHFVRNPWEMPVLFRASSPRDEAVRWRTFGVRARPRVAFRRLTGVMQFRIQPYLGKFPVTPHRYT
jgi:hypothetical protein